ncbi:hypothetical protein KCTC52924_03007 [Arenibacter antarcticus]|uniref:DUF1778 domain-containing protein n=1 Tax=Arenibacter antarcticus TaxID=2040469 RepID=A0ABW5VJU0_9FLAO
MIHAYLKNKKLFFERAACLGGYRGLTDSAVLTVQEKAKKIIAEIEQILVSKKDSEILLDAITNPPKANKNHMKAASENQALLSKNELTKNLDSNH